LKRKQVKRERTIKQRIKETSIAGRPYLLNHRRKTCYNCCSEADKLQRLGCEQSFPLEDNWRGTPKVGHVILK